MKIFSLFRATVALTLSFSPGMAADLKVKITPDIASVTVKHNGKDVTIQREQTRTLQ